MKTLNETIKQIDKFFYDLYSNGEASKTEIINFFYDYINFILLYNEIDISKLNITLHLTKKFNDSVEDFRVKPKKKTKSKQRNKENAKKHSYEKYSQTLAYCHFDRSTLTYDVYLNENNCKAKDIYNLIDFTYLISSLGHEIEHLVQEFLSSALVHECEGCYDKKLSTFTRIVRSSTNANFIRRLANKMHTHADNFSILNTCEINADNNAVVYFGKLFEFIKDSTNKERPYYYFLYNICIDLERIQQSREKTYRFCEKQDKAIKKSLVRDFKIDESVLTII